MARKDRSDLKVSQFDKKLGEDKTSTIRKIKSRKKVVIITRDPWRLSNADLT